MPLFQLLSVPKNDNEWELFSFSLRDQINQIRKAIYNRYSQVLSVEVTDGGFYTEATGFPTIFFVGGLGTGAGAEVSEGTAGVIQQIAVTNGGRYYTSIPQVVFSIGTATATATVGPTINLVEYQLYPVDFNHSTDWLDNVSQSMQDINSVLGLQSVDLEDVDLKDYSQLQSWVNLLYQELYSASAALGI